MKITSKGQVTIPQEFREKLGLLPNSEVTFKVVGNSLRISKSKSGQKRGKALIEKIRGKSNLKISTDEILKLTRS